ncbi:MAG: hypothetical protein WC661_04690 [Opitutaceae bacterium]|jgi:hypothetical protein
MKLADIIFIVVGCGLLAAILIPTSGSGTSAETSITKVEMAQAAAALFIYHQEYGTLPAENRNAKLVEILEGNNPRKYKFYILDRAKSKTSEFIDGWGNPLAFKRTATGMLMRSAGKDGIFYTKDDVTREFQSPQKTNSGSTP